MIRLHDGREKYIISNEFKFNNALIIYPFYIS